MERFARQLGGPFLDATTIKAVLSTDERRPRAEPVRLGRTLCQHEAVGHLVLEGYWHAPEDRLFVKVLERLASIVAAWHGKMVAREIRFVVERLTSSEQVDSLGGGLAGEQRELAQ